MEKHKAINQEGSNREISPVRKKGRREKKKKKKGKEEEELTLKETNALNLPPVPKPPRKQQKQQ